jgi:hypothetical protein
MVLNIPGIKNPIFQQSKIEDVGIGQKKLSETLYLSIPGCTFRITTAATEAANANWRIYADNGTLETTANDNRAFCPVFLPQGAVITAAVVIGTATNTWTLYRREDSSDAETMSSSTCGTESLVINGAIVDNITYQYFFQVDDVDATDDLTRARITYQY